MTKKWQPPLTTRFDFEYTALDSPGGEIVTGREIAYIPFATMITEHDVNLTCETLPDNPLAAAKFARSLPARPYNSIFISYSRKDKQVDSNYRLAQLALDNDVFMDTYSIRTGEDWRAALAKAINRADIFQRFWLPASADSPNVRDEWDYALNHRCAEDGCAGFIRPVFWQEPMPEPPSELSHLNFKYVPFTTEKT